MSGRNSPAPMLRTLDGGEPPASPPVPFTLPRPGRKAPPRGVADHGAVARDARFFIAVAVVLWGLIALEVAVLAASLL